MIGFAVPWALLGLAAAALPLLLHLVQRHEPPEVVFPAVRYLQDATRDQSRRLKLRNWLLLLLRTLLVVAVVLAAAGATVRSGGTGAHAPSALVVIVDNSASSATVVDGVPVLSTVLRAADAVLRRATLADRVWLIAADGIPRGGTPGQLRAHLAELAAEPVRLDLGSAVGTARDLIRGTGRAGEAVVVTDGQRSAFSAARGAGPVLVLHAAARAPINRGVVTLDAGSQPWGPAGGRVTLQVTSSDTAPVPVTLTLGDRSLRDVLVTPGAPTVERIGTVPVGWTTLTATLPPDEFRWDDTRTIALEVSPPPSVRWNTDDHYLATALAVLAADGRIRSGAGITVGDLAAGPSIVIPPSDPARLGALNRALAARNVGWRFGALTVAPGRTDSSAVLPVREKVARRITLEPVSGAGTVLATVDGAPWLVQSGNVALVGSRLDPDWSGLPLSADFVPFLEALIGAMARGAMAAPDAIAGVPLRLPDGVTGLEHLGARTIVDPAVLWRPVALGVFHLLAGPDTLGAVSVRLDPRESDLTRATDRDVRALWSGATVADLDRGPALAFRAVSRGDLRGALLVLALLCALGETVVAGRVSRRS